MEMKMIGLCLIVCCVVPLGALLLSAKTERRTLPHISLGIIILVCAIGGCLFYNNIALVILVLGFVVSVSLWRLTGNISPKKSNLIRGVALGLIYGGLISVPVWQWKRFLDREYGADMLNFYGNLIERQGAFLDWLLVILFPVIISGIFFFIMSDVCRRRCREQTKKNKGKSFIIMVLVLILGNYQIAGFWNPLILMESDHNYNFCRYLFLSRPGYVRLRSYESAIPIVFQAGYSQRILLFMLRIGGDPHARNHNGSSILSMASGSGFVDAVRYILEAGVNPNESDGLGGPLWIAASNGEEDVVKVLLKAGANPNVEDEDGMSVLGTSLAQNHTEVGKALLAKGANPNIIFEGRTPLTWGIERTCNTFVCQLLEYKADPNLTPNDGASPLCLAASSGNLEIVKLLLGSGANVNARDEFKESSLHLSVQEEHLKVVELLLKYSADINAQNDMGESPLHLAVSSGNRKIVELLVKKGASMNVKDDDGKTALDYANELTDSEKQKEIVNYLKDHNIKKIIRDEKSGERRKE